MIKWGQIILVFSKWTWLVTRDRDRIPLDSPNGSALNSCPSPRLLLNFRTSLLVSTRAYGEARLRSSVWGKICRKPWIFTAFTYFLRAFHRFWPPKSPKDRGSMGFLQFFPFNQGIDDWSGEKRNILVLISTFLAHQHCAFPASMISTVTNDPQKMLQDVTRLPKMVIQTLPREHC